MLWNECLQTGDDNGEVFCFKILFILEYKQGVGAERKEQQEGERISSTEPN